MSDRPAESCVTEWLGRLKAGDAEAVRKLWEGFFPKLVELARQRLRNTKRAVADEEDVALSAFKSFCHGAPVGRFPQLNDRHDLWQVLFMLTKRKAQDLARHDMRLKRGGGLVVQASALAGEEGYDAFADVCGKEPSPELAALVAEECDRLLNMLDDEELRQIAIWKMEGRTNAEIAKDIKRVEGTVERKLKLIRMEWEGEAAS